MNDKRELHVLHKLIGNNLQQCLSSECEIVLDVACGGKQQIPLFSSFHKARITEVCKVDILIIKSDKIKAIIEIEESDIKPTQICGKFLTSLLSSYYIHKQKHDQPIPMADHVSFVEIVDLCGLPSRSAKPAQLKNMENNIQRLLPIRGINIDNYRLFCVKSSEPNTVLNEFVDFIGENLSDS